MVRWLLTLALASCLWGAFAFPVRPGSKDRQLLPLEDTGIVLIKSRRALLATQATDSSSAEEADKQHNDGNSGDADECNLQQDDDLDLCVCASSVGC